MLTRLQVRGFKNLYDVDLRFGPFTCITGKNAVGKSNIFDAIHFLHLLTQYPIMEAVQRMRSTEGHSPDPRSLFTAFGNFRASEIRFVADLILERDVEDEFGVTEEASASAVRYTLALRLADDAPERLELVEEELKPLKVSETRRRLRFPASEEFKKTSITGKGRGTSFVSTKGGQITVHQEGHGGRKVPAPKSSRTVIGGMASSDFPTVLAAHREMESWRILMLEPSAMRKPSDYRDKKLIDPRGGNLPAAIDRLIRDEERGGSVESELANRLADLIEDVRRVRVVDDEKTETLSLEVAGRDGEYRQARALSDGTLRFLVLSTLALDPEARGVLCLEEPENGIHPERIPAMLRLLQDIAVDPSFPIGADNPLRQVIVNTHSPKVVREVDRERDLVYLKEVSIARGNATARVAHVTAPPESWRRGGGQPPSVTAPGDLAPYDEVQPSLPLSLAG